MLPIQYSTHCNHVRLSWIYVHTLLEGKHHCSTPAVMSWAVAPQKQPQLHVLPGITMHPPVFIMCLAATVSHYYRLRKQQDWAGVVAIMSEPQTLQRSVLSLACLKWPHHLQAAPMAQAKPVNFQHNEPDNAKCAVGCL